MDRNALLLTRGGKLVGDMATHFLPPGIAGFERGRRHEGPGRGLPLRPTARRSRTSRAKYFKAAGYASGKYEGNEKILMVGSNVGVAAKTAEVAKEQLENMGFKITLRLVAAADDVHALLQHARRRRSRSARTSAGSRTSPTARRCSTRRSTARTSSSRATPTGPQLNDPAINDAMDKAELAAGRAARRSRGATIDKQVTATRPRDPVDLGQEPLIAVRERQRRRRAVQHLVGDLAWTSLK